MAQKGGEGKQIISKRGEAGSRGGCLKKKGAGTPLGTMQRLLYLPHAENNKVNINILIL